MDRITVYLGSDHVIQQPGFEWKQDRLRVFTSPGDAAKQACRHTAAGIVNAYQIDLDALQVKAPHQQILNGFDCYDVEIPADPADSRLSLCSEHALRSLTFLDASFVNQ